MEIGILYATLAEKLAGTTAIKWFSGHGHGILSIHRLNYLMNDMIYEWASSFSEFLKKTD